MTAAAVDWVEKNLPGPLSWIVDDALPFGWALLKLGTAVVSVLSSLSALVAKAFICNLVARHERHENGTVAQGILRGGKRFREMHRIEQLPHDRNYVITSDQHRWASVDEMDAASINKTRRLYAAVLEYYGLQEWTLIENGDAEDYWLRGGSAYGVVFDMANVLPGPDLDRAFEGRLKIDAAKMHLAKIVESNKVVYNRIEVLFDRNNRYVRTNGNHDDVNLRPEMIQELTRYFSNFRIAEYVVLEDGPKAVALISHGHQTDAWNHDACSYLGRVTTPLNSALRDLSFGEIKEGVPDAKVGDAIWAGKSANKLDEVGPFGANSDLGSLDEQALFESFRKIWGTPANIEAGPWLILGHTHVPLSSPSSPVNNGIWGRYLNTGCCIFPSMITCVEWGKHGVADAQPSPRLVAWRWAEVDQSLQRCDLSRGADGGLSAKVDPNVYSLTLPLDT
jgi:UDP-2,3-diacylglucosamine pyrophosphatase LpxH